MRVDCVAFCICLAVHVSKLMNMKTFALFCVFETLVFMVDIDFMTGYVLCCGDCVYSKSIVIYFHVIFVFVFEF